MVDLSIPELAEHIALMSGWTVVAAPNSEATSADLVEELQFLIDSGESDATSVTEIEARDGFSSLRAALHRGPQSVFVIRGIDQAPPETLRDWEAARTLFADRRVVLIGTEDEIKMLA